MNLRHCERPYDRCTGAESLVTLSRSLEKDSGVFPCNSITKKSVGHKVESMGPSCSLDDLQEGVGCRCKGPHSKAKGHTK